MQQTVVAGTAAIEVEREVWKRVLAMGLQATGHFFQMQGNGNVGETIEMPDGGELRRLDEPHRRQEVEADLRIARAAGIYFQSVANQTRFILARDALANSDNRLSSADLQRLRNEIKNMVHPDLASFLGNPTIWSTNKTFARARQKGAAPTAFPVASPPRNTG